MFRRPDPRWSHFREMRHQDMRPEHLFGRRMEMLTLAVLSQLRAGANWHRIARERMDGAEPGTALGRREGGAPGASRRRGTCDSCHLKRIGDNPAMDVGQARAILDLAHSGFVSM